jgi:RNA polymerase sigma factor for flagellar operon FliA
MNHSLADYDAAPSPLALAPGLEQRWLLEYLPLVKRIVNQLSLQASQTMDREDMEQIGLMGLLECLRRYGSPDEHFARFAAVRVRGAILDELRRLDWRPRQIRQQAHQVRDVLRALARRLGRQPRESEALQASGLSSAQYQAYLQAQAGEAIESLDALLLDGERDFGQEGSCVEARVHSERLLAQALDQLNERERLVLTLYYQHELNLKEIGLVLDISDARVCQLSKQALDKARTFLTKRS